MLVVIPTPIVHVHSVRAGSVAPLASITTVDNVVPEFIPSATNDVKPHPLEILSWDKLEEENRKYGNRIDIVSL